MTIEWNGKRAQERSKMTKSQLASMHVTNGGLMGLNTYLKWSKDELVNVILSDEDAWRYGH